MHAIIVSQNIPTCVLFRRIIKTPSLTSAVSNEAMHLSAEDQNAFRFGGYLHAIGKIGVRDTILPKPDSLTPEERTEIN